MNKATVVNHVTDYTFLAVSDLASYANELEEIGFIRQAEKLRHIAGELENVGRSLLERVAK